MESKPGLANILNLKPSSALRYTKYFPNNAEYASKVYPEKKKRPPKHRDAETQTEEAVIVPPYTQTDDQIVDAKTRKGKKTRRARKTPLAFTSATQTEGFDLIQSYTQTDDTAVVETGIQTVPTDVPDSQKVDFVEKPQRQNFELLEKQLSLADNGQQSTTSRQEQSQESPSSGKTDIDLRKIWEDLKKFGEPRIVVSLIGAYDERSPTYELVDYLLLKKAIDHVARYAGRCGFIYQDEDANLLQSVVNRCCPIGNLPHTYMYGYVSTNTSEDTKEKKEEVAKEETENQKQKAHDTSRDVKDVKDDVAKEETEEVAKEETEEVAKEDTENQKQQTQDTSRNVKDVKDLLKLEKHINSTEKVSFKDRKVEPNLQIRVPVTLLVLNGDFDTLEHVLRALYSDMSIVVVKGTGGAADLIALCLEDCTKLKRELPMMFARRFPKSLFDKIQEVINLIVQKEYLISIFDIKVDEYDTLWERFTDGILRAWSFEEEHAEKILTKEYLPMDGGKYISMYVADISGLTRRELFAGYSLKKRIKQENEKNEKDNESDEENHQNVFLDSFQCGNTAIMEQILNNDENFTLPKEKFEELWKKRMDLIRGTSFHKLLQSLYVGSITNVKALKEISEKLLKGLCFSKIGIVTCCRCRSKESKEDDSIPPMEFLRLAVLENNKIISALLWYHCDNPIMTALIASTYLTALANFAERRFDENDQKELQNHAELFLSRAVKLLEKMFTDDENVAMEALDNVSEVWDHTESPLHFGHQFNIEEFISHSSNQKDANKRLFSYNKTEDQYIQLGSNNGDRKTAVNGFFPFIEYHWKNSKLSLITAPVTMMALHCVFFTTALIIFSLFLTLNLQADSISLPEGVIFIYMLGDLLEEIWSMIRPEKDCKWSPQRICLHLLNIWNFMDLLCLTLYILGFSMHILDSNLLVHIRRIYSISLFIMFLRLLNILLLFKYFGIIVIMVKEMLVDLLKYLVILSIFILAAGVVYHANIYPNHTATSDILFRRMWTILKIPYWQVYGELFLDTLEATDDSDCTNNATLWKNDPSVERCPTADGITPVIAAVYMMLTNWLLLNIVIAMFSSRFKTIQKKSEQKWRYYRHSVVIGYEHSIPSPLNFPFRIISVINFTRHVGALGCACCRKKNQGNKKDMLKKQRQFAKQIIEEEKHPKTK